MTTAAPQKPTASLSRRRLSRRLSFTLTPLIAIALFLWYIGVIGGNVHTVVPGRVYRSAQLTGKNLDAVLAEDHIRSQIDLRGGSMDDGFYRSEIASCKRYGVTHYDVTMSARRLPDPAKLQKLFDIFDHAQYPILYHCKAGSDRTGLVSTLYLHVYRHIPLDQAEAQGLTWRYGHFSFGETHAMNDFFTLYRKTGDGMPIRQWISARYPAIYKETHEGVDMGKYAG
jgi:protein tyrosine phosphatase (PTP) superfamily phosphohydrolase (DUF442 family)